MKIIVFENIFQVVDQNGLPVIEFSNKIDAVNYIKENEGIEKENIEEQPFYEVDEHGEFIS